jgi:hypothetical protein
MSLTWNQCAVLIFIMMLIGVLLAVTLPIWFAPPLTFYTYIFYEVLALAWIPLFILCLLLRPTGSKVGIILVSIIGFFVAAYIGASLAYNLILSSNRFNGAVQDCQEELTTDNRVLYTCTFIGFTDTDYVLRFTGAVDSFFVYLVD